MPRGRGLLGACLLAAGLTCASAAGVAAQPDMPRVQIWADPTDGLAIGGYDPVAYWTLGEPREGRGQLEYEWGGAVWRFRNPGNRDAFVRDPDAYMPRFGGNDVTALAGRNVVQGHPAIWAIHENRLLLFANGVNRRLWEEDKAAVLAKAVMAWPEMSRIVPPFDPPAKAAAPAPAADAALALQLLPAGGPQAMKPGLSNSRDSLP